ncbi:uncharacterized protein N7459_006226 [Penicillium hispanicum]|uniref:uncharacterized protein n=1 Tax=Penicillium hispanicum TaxID=1080232 RepID=UPI00253FE227|nr:uncharacterized protein N7459_006226 [Penicillium hispanicum]KAJ5580241.1 hypothetical protein N7459_006226 [Penicillium hispanicum]
MRPTASGHGQFYHCTALNDQTDILDADCTATDVASVWTSILVYWFPPDEGYQIRLQHDPNWTEVYVIRVAQRPGDMEISFNTLFVVRCYGAGPTVPPMGPWDQAIPEMPASVARLSRSVNSTWRPIFGAIAWGDTVRLFDVNAYTTQWATCEEWAGVIFLNLLKDQIQDFLDHVKGEFAAAWGAPYSYHWAGDHTMATNTGEVGNDKGVAENEHPDSEEDSQRTETESVLSPPPSDLSEHESSVWDVDRDADDDTEMTSGMASDVTGDM